MTTQSARNLEHVQRIYDAFGKGDLPTILAGFSPDGVISFEGASRAVPWHATARGAEITAFFATLAEAVEFEIFDPQGWVTGEDTVAVQLHLRYRIKRTGKTVDQRQVHWWTLDAGKVMRVHHFEDTHQVIAACA
ncbi:MAG TPA: nuclear transport factor 2 family protein [Kofleriaceae bacterium]|nr:nuclear transport factor 2 family protein [Kofleriaceae bacterium]